MSDNVAVRVDGANEPVVVVVFVPCLLYSMFTLR